VEKVAACRSLVTSSAVVDADGTGLLYAHLKGYRFERNPRAAKSAPRASRAVAVKRRSSGTSGHVTSAKQLKAGKYPAGGKRHRELVRGLDVTERIRASNGRRR
jgi:hypothetical protein